MQRSEVINQLKHYISTQVLDGKDIGLDEATPLLEWGIINSIEIVRLLSFIEKQFGVAVPLAKMTADNFTSLGAIAGFVLEVDKEDLADQRNQQVNSRT
jgi:acyl carrier protein